MRELLRGRRRPIKRAFLTSAWVARGPLLPAQEMSPPASEGSVPGGAPPTAAQGGPRLAEPGSSRTSGVLSPGGDRRALTARPGHLSQSQCPGPYGAPGLGKAREASARSDLGARALGSHLMKLLPGLRTPFCNLHDL